MQYAYPEALLTVDSFRSSDDSGNESVLEGLTLNLFEIKKIDVREVIIESKNGEFKLELDEFLMRGLRIKGDDFDLGALSVASNMLDISFEDTAIAMFDCKVIPFKRRIVGTVKSEMHQDLLRHIGFTIALGAMTGEMVGRLQAFDGSVEIVSLGTGVKQSVTIKDFTPSDYLGEDRSVLLKNISLSIISDELEPKTGEKTQLRETGHFDLGIAKFVMNPQLVRKAAEKSMPN